MPAITRNNKKTNADNTVDSQNKVSQDRSPKVGTAKEDDNVANPDTEATESTTTKDTENEKVASDIASSKKRKNPDSSDNKNDDTIEKPQETKDSASSLPLTKKPRLNNNIPPNVTLYINNLNDQINTVKLRESLFMLFSTYGDIIDINMKPQDKKMRGQAHVTFAKLDAAKLALRSLQEESFFEKPLNIQFSSNQNKKLSLI
ncbi:U2 snRNP complex subunit [Saccharomycopsis crataegensis]|uniref:U2 snRNP complex subunit n=1 Tax=Saccharomycopsis crataegensis TaxID=43959 RepID=A0AAV5QEG2_9ASCO|nr:U2 snRNP complex subunit [Saccharomycopsis crataegensis]